MKYEKNTRFLAFLLSLLLLLSSFSIHSFANYEDGLVIPGMDTGGYDDSYYDDYFDDYYDDYEYEVTPDDIWTNTVETPTVPSTNNKQENTDTNKVIDLDTPETEMNSGISEYIYTTDSVFVINMASDRSSSPTDYLGANGGTMTIVADRPLNNILHYDGNIVDNIHIAKWVLGDPSALKYPAYCATPGIKGVAQHTDKQYKILPQGSLSENDKRVLAVLRAGYPFKSPAELGVDSVDDAYYATHAAVHTTIQNGDLSKWSVDTSDTARNTKILEAMKKIYAEGNASPYTPPEINFSLVANNETATDGEQWVENTYSINSDYPYNYYRFELMDNTIKGLVDTGKIVVESGGSAIQPQLNINGTWDDKKAYKIPAGQTVTIKYDKSLAESAKTINFPLYANICDVDFDSTYSYLGTPDISGDWQRYAYTSVPFQSDTNNFAYNYIPDTDVPTPPGTSSEGSLVIVKQDFNTKQKVADAIFQIKGVDVGNSYMNITVKASKNATLPTLSTGEISVEDGVIRLSKIPSGSYEITEVSPPPHYTVAVGQNSQSVEVVDDAKIYPEVLFENKPYGSLKIEKTSDSGTPLAGVYFHVENHTTGFEQDVVTNTAGIAEILDIPEGSYEIVEIATRPDMILDETPHIGEVDWGEETTVLITNKEKPSIEILKIDSETSEPISGVVFEIKHKDTNQSYSETTDGEGKIKISGVDEGWFDVREVTPASGYIASNEVYEVYAESGKPGSITIKNTKKSGITIEKVDSSGNPLAGVSFNIFNFGGDTPIPNSPVTTNEQGIAVLESLNPGHYQVQEVAALPGYLLDTNKYDLIVEDGEEQNTKIQIVNKRLPDLVVKKVDHKNPDKGLAGAMFEVRLVDGPALEGSPYTTGADGTFTIENVPLGKYMVTEIKAPDGYEISDPAVRYVTIDADKDIELTFGNKLSPDLKIRKVDATDVTKGLPGAMFEVKQVDGQKLEASPYTTNENGEILISDLPLGKYIITEIKAPDGYEISKDNIQYATLEAGKDIELTYINKKTPGLTVKKVDANKLDKGLAGAMFEVKQIDGQQVAGSPFTTGADGSFFIPQIMPGKYAITEIKAPTGYEISAENVQYTTMEPGQDVILTFTNEETPDLTVKKVDKTDPSKGLAGAVFEVKEVDGQKVAGSPFTTGMDGTFTIIDLKPGKYEVTEIQPPSGYELSDPVTQYATMEPGQDITLTFINDETPDLTIIKLDKQTGDPLAGAMFEVEKLEEPHKGKVTGSPFTTNGEGKIVLPNLPTGSYKLKEIKAPLNYVIDTEERIINLKQGEDFEAKFEDLKKPSIIVNKIDSITKNPLKNAKFTVSMAVNNSLNGEIKEVGKFVSDAMGQFRIDYLEPGWYRIEETEAPSGYVIKGGRQDVFLTAGEDKTLTFENAPQSAIIIRKVDAETGQALEGIRFEVKYLSGATGTEGTTIGTYTTTHNGTVVIAGLKPGVYSVAELQADSDHILDDTIKTVTLADDNSVVTVEFSNSPLGGLLVKKYDAITKEPLSDVIFRVTDIKGAVVGESGGEYRTDETGSFYIPQLTGGFVVQEIKTKEGYVLDNTAQKIHIDKGRVYELEFFNQPLNTLLIQKIDALTKEPLADAVIKITTADDKFVAEEQTDSSGIVVIGGLTPGRSYKVQEVQAPAGYILDNTVKTVTMEKDKPAKLELYNQPENSFVIQKLDGATQKPLTGAVIKVSTVEDQVIGEYKTDESGIITIHGLTPGSYKVQEVKSPDGYCLDDTVKLVHLKQNEPQKIELYNYEKSTIHVLKKDSVSNKPLSGAKFKVEKINGEIVGEFETDASGVAAIPDLEAGTYTVQEVQPPKGYQLNSKPQTVIVKENKVYSIEFYNDPLNGFSIIKMDGNTKQPLSNARFKITKADDQLIGEYRTDENGMITLNDLEAGTYKVIELEAPKGYNLDNTVHLVNLKQNEPQRLELYNYEKAVILIQKKDSITKAPLANAEFKVVKTNGLEIGKYKTDATGIVAVPGVEAGSYIIQEIQAPDGYILNNTPQVVEVSENKVYSIDFYNDPLDSFVIIKMDGNTKEPLADALIRVTTVTDTFIGEYRTDSSGMITIKDILPGTYKIQEIKQPDGYVLDDTVKLITIEQNKPQKLELFNYKTASLIIQKVDKTTQKPLKNAKFKLTKIDGTMIGEYMTGDDGKAVVPSLNPGWYTVTEIAAPKGYNIDVVPSKNVQVKAFEPAIVKFENYKNATLRIEKTDKVTGNELENVEFSITRSDGKTYGKHRTDKRGEINLENQLPAGTYLIRETETVKGYALDTNVRKITLSWGDDKLIEWENYPLASLQIEKTDSENGKGIEGVQFEVFDKNKKSIGKFTTDNKGRIRLDKMLVGDTIYYVQEVEPKEGYIPQQGMKTVNTKWGKTTYLDIENQPILGRVQIHKTAADNNPITGVLKDTGLAGAQFTIYDANGKKIEVLTTDSKGYAISGKLRYGEYTMKETFTPLYYLNENETIQFKIEKDGETVELERKNKSTILQVNIEKSGYKEVMGGNTIRYDLFNIQNKSIVPLTNFYLLESIPSDATRITRLFTGTYNQNLNYTILYKTNKNGEFKILKDNLFSDRVYEIDCTKGLQAGEFVTDIKFEFGTVDIGFREVERPFLYCKVNDNLANGYQFTNHAEVGGNYEMQKVKAEDNFTTKVFAPAQERGKLPKTGY